METLQDRLLRIFGHLHSILSNGIQKEQNQEENIENAISNYLRFLPFLLNIFVLEKRQY